MNGEVNMWNFAGAHADGAFVLDVREPHEYVAGHVPGAKLMPLSMLTTHVDELPLNEPIYVICQGGSRSRVAAQELARHGRDARSVIGGTSGWIGTQRPVVRGERANCV